MKYIENKLFIAYCRHKIGNLRVTIVLFISYFYIFDQD